MLSLPNGAAIEAALTQSLDPELSHLLKSHLEQARSADLLDLTHILVIQPGDTEEAIQAEIGFSPLVNPMDGTRYGDPSFQPYWPWLQDRVEFCEMIVPVGNSGFAFIILIEKSEGVLPDLLQLCADFASGDSA